LNPPFCVTGGCAASLGYSRRDSCALQPFANIPHAKEIQRRNRGRGGRNSSDIGVMGFPARRDCSRDANPGLALLRVGTIKPTLILLVVCTLLSQPSPSPTRLASQSGNPILRARDVCTRVGLSRTTIWRMIRRASSPLRGG